MKKSDIRVGMKVTPLSKSVAGILSSSHMWHLAQENNQKFLYVIRIDRDHLSLAPNKRDTSGDWFIPSDLVPYPQKELSPVQMLKKLVSISSKALDADIELQEKERNEIMDDLWSALREAKSVIKRAKK